MAAEAEVEGRRLTRREGNGGQNVAVLAHRVGARSAGPTVKGRCIGSPRRPGCAASRRGDSRQTGAGSRRISRRCRVNIPPPIGNASLCPRAGSGHAAPARAKRTKRRRSSCPLRASPFRRRGWRERKERQRGAAWPGGAAGWRATSRSTERRRVEVAKGAFPARKMTALRDPGPAS